MKNRFFYKLKFEPLHNFLDPAFTLKNVKNKTCLFIEFSKVKRIFECFDTDDDGNLNRIEMSMLLSTTSPHTVTAFKIWKNYRKPFFQIFEK